MCNQRGFGAGAVNVARFEGIAHLCGYGNIILLLLVQRGNIAALGDKCAAYGHHIAQRTLNTIKYIGDDTGTQHSAYGRTGRNYRLAYFQPRGVLVDLNCRKIIIYAYDLTDKLSVANVHHFQHGEIARISNLYNRAVYGIYLIQSVSFLSVSYSLSSDFSENALRSSATALSRVRSV